MFGGVDRAAALALASLVVIAHGLVPVAPRRPVPAAVGRAAVRMAAVQPQSTVLVVGRGPMQLLVAKQAALAGYDTRLLASSGNTDELLELLFDEEISPEKDFPNLKLVQVFDKDAVENAIQTCEGVLIATDSDDAMKPGVIDTVVPLSEPTKIKRVVAMSRNGASGKPGSGKGMGPLVQASKDFSNPEIWAGSDVFCKSYKAMEEKIVQNTAELGADYCFVRAGTLKGGGPGAPTTAEGLRYPHASYGLSAKLYDLGIFQRWRMLFDMTCQGAKLVPGDAAEGPGLFAVPVSTSFNAEKGDTGRHALAAAMVQALSQSKASNNDFAVVPEASRVPPTQGDWDDMFSKLA